MTGSGVPEHAIEEKEQLMPKYPDSILWLDLETTSLDKKTGHILEVGVILTNTDLQPLKGYQAAIKLTPGAVAQIRADEFIQNMHLENGLLKECKYSDTTLRDAELAIINEVLEPAGATKGSVMLAGSGVARFDSDFIERLMPELWTWLAYFVLDTGILRRAAHLAAPGQEIFPKVEESFREGQKKHRAYDDVSAHLTEARGQFEALRQLA